MEEKYRFLPFAAGALRVIGWIVLVLGFVGSLVFGIGMGGIAGLFVALTGVIGSFLAWLFLLASRELLFLLMDVEENTRNTATGIARESTRHEHTL